MRDDVQLVVQPFPGRLRGPPAAGPPRAVAAPPPVPAAQDRVPHRARSCWCWLGRGAVSGMYRSPMPRSRAGSRAHRAPAPRSPAVGRWRCSGVPGPSSRRPRARGGRHVRAAGQVGPAVVRGQPRRAQRGQLPGRVEHLGGAASTGSRYRTALVSTAGTPASAASRPAGPPGRAVRLRWSTISMTTSACRASGPARPARSRRPGGDRPAHVAARAEQDDEAGGVLGDQVLRHGGGVVGRRLALTPRAPR